MSPGPTGGTQEETQPISRRTLEILRKVALAIEKVPNTGDPKVALRARALALLDYAKINASALATWLEEDGSSIAARQQLAERINAFTGSIRRPRLVGRSKLKGAPQLRPAPRGATVARL